MVISFVSLSVNDNKLFKGLVVLYNLLHFIQRNQNCGSGAIFSGSDPAGFFLANSKQKKTYDNLTKNKLFILFRRIKIGYF